MLVLSRKKNEWTELQTSDGPVRMCVVDIRGDKVRLGWDAPQAVKILRDEVKDRPAKPKPTDGQANETA
jgi:carbon storage regulator